MQSKGNIQVFDNPQQLSEKAAEIFVSTANKAVETHGRFTVALTGGSSPALLYELLTTPEFAENIPWSKSYFFWGDERWVPLSNDKSNARMSFEYLLDDVPVPKENIFVMWGEQEPEQFAMQYEEQLIKHFGSRSSNFDLTLLGMGDDGHTASLFPGTEVLNEQERLVRAYHLQEQSMYRITLTAPCINNSSKVVFLVTGEKKADALYEVLQGETNPQKYPAQLIKPVNGEVIWLVDKQASKKLTT